MKNNAVKLLYVLGLIVSIICFIIAIVIGKGTVFTIFMSMGISGFVTTFIGLFFEILKDKGNKKSREYMLRDINYTFKLFIHRYITNLFYVNINFLHKGKKNVYYNVYMSDFIDFNNDILSKMEVQANNMLKPKDVEMSYTYLDKAVPFYENLKACIRRLLDMNGTGVLLQYFSESEIEILNKACVDLNNYSSSYMKLDDVFQNIIDLKDVLNLKKFEKFDVYYYNNQVAIYDMDCNLWEVTTGFTNVNKNQVENYEYFSNEN